jgi:2,3-bisphosphoglycerate-independent phosphoglycerate mutase
MNPCMLLILDGFGIRKEREANAIQLAQMPHYQRFLEHYPHTALLASGYDVGLPAGLMGNSEVGHLNMAAGEVVWQTLSRIDKSMEDGSFVQNPCLNDLVTHALTHKKAIHLMGLVSDGGVHSSHRHYEALLDFFQKKGVPQVYFHVFTDGRDTPPHSGKLHVEKLQSKMKELQCGEILTISGRYFAMDRDNRWERIEKAYQALVHGQGYQAPSPESAIQAAYDRGESDEFISPTVIRHVPFTAGDVLFFFNFRADRARQITRIFVDSTFQPFKRDPLPVISFAAMVPYETGFHYPYAFNTQIVKNSLGELVSQHQFPQLRIAETEKFAHVTFFFSGGREQPFPLEDRVLIPSPKVATYDLKPEMSAYEVTDRVLQEIDKNFYKFIVLNFANPDMVGHTGILPAAIQAVEAVDRCLGRIEKAILAKQGTLLLTADHGNCEMMVDPETGAPHTAHTTNPVPAIVIGEGYSGIRLAQNRRLCDIAPTLASFMNLPLPPEMKAQGLIFHG